MAILRTGEITRMINNTASSSFTDTCTLDIKSVTRNEFGEEEATYTSGSIISCGFEWLSGTEAVKGELIPTQSKGKFRLPITSVISIEDRITLINRYNQTENLIFNVVSEPLKNLDCLLVEVINLVV